MLAFSWSCFVQKLTCLVPSVANTPVLKLESSLITHQYVADTQLHDATRCVNLPDAEG